ncbi:hypothetical protein IWW55_002741 [Coemansia sp. RSA 2706]|nr:hypothetical protein IWW55_002741 [Coemansia sp. RSA 2706]
MLSFITLTKSSIRRGFTKLANLMSGRGSDMPPKLERKEPERGKPWIVVAQHAPIDYVQFCQKIQALEQIDREKKAQHAAMKLRKSTINKIKLAASARREAHRVRRQENRPVSAMVVPFMYLPEMPMKPTNAVTPAKPMMPINPMAPVARMEPVVIGPIHEYAEYLHPVEFEEYLRPQEVGEYVQLQPHQEYLQPTGYGEYVQPQDYNYSAIDFSVRRSIIEGKESGCLPPIWR